MNDEGIIFNCGMLIMKEKKRNNFCVCIFSNILSGTEVINDTL